MNTDKKTLADILKESLNGSIELGEDWYACGAAAVEAAVMERLSIRDARLDRELAEELAMDDPNAECKAAFKAGKRIQFRWKDSPYDGFKDLAADPNWNPSVEYRIHPDDVEPEIPWTLGRSVNGHTLADGQEWHRTDWTKDMLPGGYRPLSIGEMAVFGDQFKPEAGCDSWQASWQTCTGCYTSVRNSWKHRTTRPLPAPVDPFADAKQWLAEGRLQYFAADMWYDWKSTKEPCWMMWKPEQLRRRPDPVMVPLGPDDVPPGSMLRNITDKHETWHWRLISYVTALGAVCADRGYPWTEIMWSHEINRNDGRGWVACSKEQPSTS